jgi:hypothetical protein
MTLLRILTLALVVISVSRGGIEFEMTLTGKGGGALAGQPALTYAPSDKTDFHSVEFEGVNIEFTGDGFRLKQGSTDIEFKRKVTPK